MYDNNIVSAHDYPAISGSPYTTRDNDSGFNTCTDNCSTFDDKRSLSNRNTCTKLYTIAKSADRIHRSLADRRF
jgi:hypothetical protein